MSATTYRYLFADLITNSIIAELPLTNVQFSQILNDIGSFSGNMLLSDVREAGYDLNQTTIPGKTAIYVDRNGVLIWGGIIWSRNYQASTQVMTIQANEFMSYFQRRRIADFLDYELVDQLSIAQQLVTHAQGATGGNIGITVGTETSGALVSRTFYPYQYLDYYTAIKDLSNAGSTYGFDFNIDVQYDTTGTPQKYLRVDYPYRGRRFDATDAAALVFDLPGSLQDYEYPENGAQMANTVYTIGAGSNEGALLSGYQNTSQVTDKGYPLLEDATTYSDIYDVNLLYRLAQGQVQALLNPVATPKISLPAYSDPVLGSYKTGDQILLRIADDRFPAPSTGGFGLTVIKRITSINVVAGESVPETVTLTLADLPYNIL